MFYQGGFSRSAHDGRLRTGSDAVMDNKLRAINKLRNDFARYVARRFDHPDDRGTRDRLLDMERRIYSMAAEYWGTRDAERGVEHRVRAKRSSRSRRA